ncbi:MAG: PSD1 and planctomycete cytochrome C domain-containing protein [Planctomycetales bacterium]
MASAAQAEDARQAFDEYVLPLLKQHCFECHSHDSGQADGGLVLDSEKGFLEGGTRGPAVVPGKPDESLLLQAVSHADEELSMPPDEKLSDAKIAVLRRWIEQGAVQPESAFNGIQQTERKDLWSLKPLQGPTIPHLTDASWPRSEIDRFVLARIESAGLKPVEDADRYTLLRRTYLTLIGLPPSPVEMEAFIKDPDPLPQALEKIVQRLIDTPEFGERWARHWLDVARYADTNGGTFEANNTYDNAWRYRDYVITAISEDKPFDDFVVEQIAGDFLDWTSDQQRANQIIATGFLQLGPKAFATDEAEQLRMDVLDEQIDTVSKSFLGLSFGCARCHDHKFDPISSEDYYAVAGIFSSTQSLRFDRAWRMQKAWTRVELPLDPKLAKILRDNHSKYLKELKTNRDKAKEEFDAINKRLGTMLAEGTADPEELDKARQEADEAKKQNTLMKGQWKLAQIDSVVPSALSVLERKEPRNESIRIRGLPDNRGQQVHRGVPALMPGHDPQQFPIPKGVSGRLPLARWLVDPDHGAGQLTARVIVNRVWQHVMGQGIVRSPDNFGATGQVPSHPQLLDYLATTFIDDGWSVKKLVRRIMLSRVFMLASASTQSSTVDPDNHTLSHYPARRMDAEAIRDSMLAISGELDEKRGGPTLYFQGLNRFEEDHRLLERPSAALRRSVYLPIIRDDFGTDERLREHLVMLSAFDFPDTNVTSGRRSATNVPTQALFMMNSPLVMDRAQAAAQRFLDQRDIVTDTQRIDRIFQSILGRPATESEITNGIRLLERFNAAAGPIQPDDNPRLAAWAALCQAMFGSTECLMIY